MKKVLNLHSIEIARLVSKLIDEWIAPIVGLIGVVSGVVLGAALSYVIQIKTQRNAWKKDIVETVYAGLYSDALQVKNILEKGKFDRISFATWYEFQKDLRHLQVQPDKFRAQLDDFLKNVNDYDSDVISLINVVFPDIIAKACKIVFDYIPENMLIQIDYKLSNGKIETSHLTAVLCLRERKLPRDIILEGYPESTITHFLISGFSNLAGWSPTDFDESKFNKFWKVCLELENENEIYKRALNEQSELLKESKAIFDELKKRIVDFIPS